MKLIVEGMNCQNCVRHVREALEALPGAADIRVDLPSGEVQVNGVTEEAAVQAIIEEGYRIRPQ